MKEKIVIALSFGTASVLSAFVEHNTNNIKQNGLTVKGAIAGVIGGTLHMASTGVFLVTGLTETMKFLNKLAEEAEKGGEECNELS